MLAATSRWERSAIEHRSRPASVTEASASMLLSWCTAFSSTSKVLLAIPWSPCVLMRRSHAGHACTLFAQNFVQCGDRDIHVLAPHDVRRKKTQHGLAGAVDQDA